MLDFFTIIFIRNICKIQHGLVWFTTWRWSSCITLYSLHLVAHWISIAYLAKGYLATFCKPILKWWADALHTSFKATLRLCLYLEYRYGFHLAYLCLYAWYKYIFLLAILNGLACSLMEFKSIGCRHSCYFLNAYIELLLHNCQKASLQHFNFQKACLLHFLPYWQCHIDIGLYFLQSCIEFVPLSWISSIYKVLQGKSCILTSDLLMPLLGKENH